MVFMWIYKLVFPIKWLLYHFGTYISDPISLNRITVGGRRARDRMVVGFITIYAISAYHHWSSEFEYRLDDVYSKQQILCDTVCQWLATGRWFSPGTPGSSTNKTDRHDITEILLKEALNTIILTPFVFKEKMYWFKNICQCASCFIPVRPSVYRFCCKLLLQFSLKYCFDLYDVLYTL
jgi:hypothetical protein